MFWKQGATLYKDTPAYLAISSNPYMDKPTVQPQDAASEQGMHWLLTTEFSAKSLIDKK